MSLAVVGAGVRREWRPPYPADLAVSWGPLQRGPWDPTHRLEPDGTVWRTMRTPEGVASQRVRVASGVVVADSWGPGARWAADRLPAALGADDDVTGFDPSRHPLVAELWRRFGDRLRVPAVGTVFDVLVPAILEQRVTGLEAHRSWRHLVSRFGEPAPGPAPRGMHVPPAPRNWRTIASWEWHRAGVEHARAGTVLRAAAVAHRLEECVGMLGEAARTRLTAVQGIGVWTAAEVAQRALGDPDAVSFGDIHVVPNAVYALTGVTGGTDERLAELLAPWAGHRGRVVRLLELSGITRPKRGPRYAPLDFRNR